MVGWVVKKGVQPVKTFCYLVEDDESEWKRLAQIYIKKLQLK